MQLALYFDSGAAPRAGAQNDNFDALKVWSILILLKEDRGIESDVIDTTSWGLRELTQAYSKAVEASWNGYRIRKVFGTNSNSGCFFGKSVPALIVLEDEKPVAVYPHEVMDGMIVTIRDFLDSLIDPSAASRKLAAEMDSARDSLGPIGVLTCELVNEGRRR